jgi:hypothetical protein
VGIEKIRKAQVLLFMMIFTMPKMRENILGMIIINYSIVSFFLRVSGFNVKDRYLIVLYHQQNISDKRRDTTKQKNEIEKLKAQIAEVEKK